MRALAAALALHALLALALALLPAPPRGALRERDAVEIEWRAPAPAPPPTAPTAMTAMTARPAATAAAPATRIAHASVSRRHAAQAAPTDASAAAPRAAPGASSPAASSTAASSPAAESGSPTGPVELFPRAILQGLARPPPRPDDRDTPGGWLDDANAEARTRAGGVAPVWRQVERELLQGFEPPVDVVHDTPARRIDRIGDRLRTLARQWTAVVRDESRLRHPVEPGSTITTVPMGRSIDPSQQGFLGVSEGANLRAMPLEQQQAAVAATGEPADWLRVEVEIAVDATGAIARARVVVPSGRRAFDRYALAAVQAAVTRGAASAPSTLSRWVCEAGYAVARPDSIGVTFDLSMLFDKQLRRQLAAHYPLKERVDRRVSLKWVKPLR